MRRGEYVEKQAHAGKWILWYLEAIIYDGFVGFMRLLPIEKASDLGGALFRVLGPMTSTHKTVMRNLELCFPDLSLRERKSLAIKQWEQTGRTTAEFPIMDRIKSQSWRYEIKGAENLISYKEQNRPFIVASMHMANWELVPIAVISLGLPFLVTYRAANNPLVDKKIRDGRARYGVSLFGAKGSDGSRDMIRALESGAGVGLMNDQKFNRGLRTVFFGHIAETAPGPSKLAKRFDTDLIPINVKRLKGVRFEITIHNPITPYKYEGRDGLFETVQELTKWVEDEVKSKPEDWFWVHKRWPNEIYKPVSQPRVGD
jgi:KDO2-lipid IV(A) lauroyltransferase